MRVRIHAYKAASESGKTIANALGVKSIATRSRFRAKRGDVCINWGSTNLRCNISEGSVILNHPEAVKNAANKIKTFRLFREHEIPTFTSTEHRERAFELYLEGHTIYCRTLVSSHSGNGIIMASPSDNYTLENFPSANLYTVGIIGKRREYRLHVYQGQVIATQQKKRRNGFYEIENHSDDVRSFHTGWIFATEDITVEEQVKEAAIRAVEALGMDFGAVDVTTQRGDIYVIECNSAPGLSSPTVINAYKTAIEGYINELRGMLEETN